MTQVMGFFAPHSDKHDDYPSALIVVSECEATVIERDTSKDCRGEYERTKDYKGLGAVIHFFNSENAKLLNKEARPLIFDGEETNIISVDLEHEASIAIQDSDLPYEEKKLQLVKAEVLRRLA